MTPSDLLALPAMAPGDFLQLAKQPITSPDAYLLIDLDRSTNWELWASPPSIPDAWYSLPTARVASVKPVSFPGDMNLRRVLCAVTFAQ